MRVSGNESTHAVRGESGEEIRDEIPSADAGAGFAEAAGVVRVLNADHDAEYQLIGRFVTGEWGAYRVVEPGGKPVVLKFFLDLHDTNIMDPDPHLATQITDHLRALGYPTPEHLHTGWLNNHGLYWVMEELPGEALWQDPTVDQVESLVSLLRLQREQAISEKQDLSVLVKDVVFEERHGKAEKLRSYSDETRELLHQVATLVRGLEDVPVTHGDIVHGDFSYHQAMIEDNRIVGIIDWQEAGCGDWLIDLTRLVYSLHDRPELVAPVLREAEQQDPRKLRLYTAYTLLDMVSWPLHIRDGGVSTGSISKARSAVDFVSSRF